jgi:hypothetical protein
MAALTVQQILVTGLAPSYASAAGGGDTFVNDGDTFLHVFNGGGGSINVTIAPAGSVNGIGFEDQVVAVAAGANKMIGPFDPAIFNGASGVSVSYSGVTSVTVAAIKLR